MFLYIIQTIAFQLFFLMVYDFFLKNETFFNWNRVYLLSTAVFSMLIPLIKIERFKNVLSAEYIIALPEVFIGQERDKAFQLTHFENLFSLQNRTTIWEIVFYFGVLIAILLFVFKLVKMISLLIKNPKQKVNGFQIVSLLNSTAAFSFFKFIFLGDLIKAADREVIVKHEMVHVKQHHSLDLMFFELLRILFWFNPLIYMYQNRIVVLHEFIADYNAVKYENKSTYYQSLLQQVFNTKNISFINQFFKQSLIKKRIVMLSKSKSKKSNLLKYLLIIPMVLGMLVYASGSQHFNNQEISVENNETPLTKKIAAIKSQIAVQGNVSKEEEKGLSLLLKIVKEKDLNKGFIKKVQKFMNSNGKSDLEQKIADVFEQIQIQGNVSNEEERALKKLLVLTSENGLNDPFFADIINDIDIPFGVIDKVPVFPGCEDLLAEEKRKCMAMNISKHVSKNFNTKLAKENGIIGKQRINVIFKIDNKGFVTGVRARAPHEVLKNEAIRVINSLPKMIPGEHQGKKVNVPYSLPIIFQIADEIKTKK